MRQRSIARDATVTKGMHRTLLVADSGSKIPPTDLLGAVSFSTKTLSSSGINRFDIAIARRV